MVAAVEGVGIPVIALLTRLHHAVAADEAIRVRPVDLVGAGDFLLFGRIRGEDMGASGDRIAVIVGVCVRIVTAHWRGVAGAGRVAEADEALVGDGTVSSPWPRWALTAASPIEMVCAFAGAPGGM